MPRAIDQASICSSVFMGLTILLLRRLSMSMLCRRLTPHGGAIGAKSTGAEALLQRFCPHTGPFGRTRILPSRSPAAAAVTASLIWSRP
ncbi:hypothetical protein [Lysobacter gummosus]|uniref:hypothetical protein n=1 Tax=Lysobacter gummosus TaxID=262324 RepID=UPI00362F3A28